LLRRHYLKRLYLLVPQYIPLRQMATNGPPLDQVVAAMLKVLGDYLSRLVPPMPIPNIAVVSLTERSVGLGGWRGMKKRDVFPVVTLKGIRLEALVRFQLRAPDLGDVETGITDVIARLMGGRDILRTEGILKLALEAFPPADHIDSLGAWRKTADFRILYEFRYEDTDGAEGLIARIPIASDLEAKNSPEREMMVITDEMVRWDNETAPALIIRGPIRVEALSALTFVPASAPSGTITLMRTFDGAAGTPTSYANLSDFLSAVGRPATPDHHAVVAFASLTDFLAAFAIEGDPVALGRDSYQARVLNLEPAILLPRVMDRLEIAYQDTNFDQTAVVYLRSRRG
jgi:hypothetical protein